MNKNSSRVLQKDMNRHEVSYTRQSALLSMDFCKARLRRMEEVPHVVLGERYIFFMRGHRMNSHFSLTLEAYRLVDRFAFHITVLLIYTHTTLTDKYCHSHLDPSLGPLHVHILSVQCLELVSSLFFLEISVNSVQIWSLSGTGRR